MKQVSIYVPVQITASDFRTFALFDTFQRKKLWRRPALFIAIMEVSAVLCYSRYPQEGSLLLGTILAVLGLALPLIWYLSMSTACTPRPKRWACSKAPAGPTPSSFRTAASRSVPTRAKPIPRFPGPR